MILFHQFLKYDCIYRGLTKLSAGYGDDDIGYYNGTLNVTVPDVSPYCFQLYKGESWDNTIPFQITFNPTSTTSMITQTVTTGTMTTSHAPATSSVSQTVPPNIAAAASSSAAALAYADANAQAAHDKSVGLGVGLGLVFPIVVAISAAAAALLFCSRRRKGEAAQSRLSGTIEHPIYQTVGTEQASSPMDAVSGGRVERKESTRVLALIEKIQNLRQ